MDKALIGNLHSQVNRGLFQIETAVQNLRYSLEKEYTIFITKGFITENDIQQFRGSVAAGLSGLVPGGIDGGAGPSTAAGGNVATGPGGAIKTEKKAKRPHDKNAPKKATTPFFLFMKTMRPQIQEELGENPNPKEVDAIGQMRWKNLTTKEREKVNNQYYCNRAAYYKKMYHYKRGEPIPDVDNAEAKELYKAQKRAGITNRYVPLNAPHPPPDASDEEEDEEEVPNGDDAAIPDDGDDGINGDDGEVPAALPEDEDEEEEEEEKEPTPPPPPKSNKRQKNDSGKAVPTPSAGGTKAGERKSKFGIPPPAVTPAAATPPGEQKKKEKRKVKGAGLDSTPIPVVLSPEKSVEKKKSKKKRKSEIVEDED
ncbi:hypothetical protein MMC25_003445 [Agyrium rufum]|nr:hypothetical protein [Agyrium rufum]